MNATTFRSRVATWLARLALSIAFPAAAAADCLFTDGFDGLIPSPSPGASAQIAAARAAADGATDLAIAGAEVTYVKPAIGADAGGFFVQAADSGPAVFVAVAAGSLDPAPQPGDIVSFHVTQMATSGSLREATAVSSWSVAHSGARLSCLLQEVSAATDLVSAVTNYESELIAVDGTVTGTFQTSGSQVVSAPMSTDGVPNDSNLRLQLPVAVQGALDIVTGCSFALLGAPMWRFNAQAEVSAWDAGDIDVVDCPPPTVISAVALDSTHVTVNFDRTVDATSLAGDGSQFQFDAGLQATGVSASGKSITVATSMQTPGTAYTVTVAPSVLDLLGHGIAAANDSAVFLGYQLVAALRINELNANIGGGCDLVELRVTSGGSMNGIQVWERTASVLTFSDFTVQKNDIIIIHFNANSVSCNPNGATNETTAADQQPAAMSGGNFDTAYDWHIADTGLANTTNVITVYAPGAMIMDAVFLANDTTCAAAADTETQALAVVNANQWHAVGSEPAGGYIDDGFCANAVQDLDATGTTTFGVSIQRLSNTDANDAADWGMAAATFGAINAGQSLLAAPRAGARN